MARQKIIEGYKPVPNQELIEKFFALKKEHQSKVICKISETVITQKSQPGFFRYPDLMELFQEFLEFTKES